MATTGVLYRLPVRHNTRTYALTERGFALRETNRGAEPLGHRVGHRRRPESGEGAGYLSVGHDGGTARKRRTGRTYCVSKLLWQDSCMDASLSRSLHALVGTLDRAADRILRAEHDTSYHTFLLLFAVAENAGGSQRDVAEWVGSTEAPVSRSLRRLADDGLVEIGPASTRGHRRQVSLTAPGRDLLHSAGADLERRLADVVDSAQVDYAAYAEMTARLVAALQGDSRKARS